MNLVAFRNGENGALAGSPPNGPAPEAPLGGTLVRNFVDFHTARKLV